jgi:hypothetical protein
MNFGKMEVEYFLSEGLDRGDRVEMVGENRGFGAAVS